MSVSAKPLTAPIDTSRWKSEKDVKKAIKQLLDQAGFFHWMPAANGFGAQGVHDHLGIKDGVFLTVEAKFNTNKPIVTQCTFAKHIMVNAGFSFCVNEKNIDHLVFFLESFNASQARQLMGQDVEDDHGARMLNAISVLTDLWV